MRFGRDLHWQQVPEWTSCYVRYAELKKLSKFAAKAVIQGNTEAANLLLQFKAALKSDIARVEAFYLRQQSVLEQKIALLCKPYGNTTTALFHAPSTIHELSHQKAESFLATCFEIRLGFKRLQWYGKVNRAGFVNLLGKLKRLSSTNFADNPLHQCEFSRQSRSLDVLDQMERALISVDSATFTRPAGDFELEFNTGHDDALDVNNHISNLIIRMGQKASSRIKPAQDGHLQESEATFGSDRTTSLMVCKGLLDHLLPADQNEVLFQKDTFGRSPLHYAANYGLSETCRAIFQRVSNGSDLAHTILSLDSEGYAPLHLAVINGQAATVETLLQCLQIKDVAATAISELGLCATLSRLTGIAVRSEFTEIIKQLLSTGKVDLNYQTESGETPLFIAAQAGRADYVKLLIGSTSTHELDLNIFESAYGWTPLIVACVQNELDIVKILLDAGADEYPCDAFGWTASDHIAFRGFWEIGKLLSTIPQDASARIPKIRLHETNDLSPCKYGETRIFVNLGSLDTRKPKPAVNMDLYLSKLPHNPYPEAGFSIKVSAIGATGSTDLIPLPILNDTTNYPHVFTTPDLNNARLIFSVFKACINSPGENKHIGGGVALLAELKSHLGTDRESLIRNHTIPVLDKSSLEHIGAITFEFLVVKPFPNPNVHLPRPSEIWNRAAGTQVIGHRGLGQNHPSFERLQIGENTIQSFLATMDLGVSYVECDVQLTRDHVPIIYHDFLLSESGADLAPHNLSFEQFMHISEIQIGNSVSAVVAETVRQSDQAATQRGSPPSRSRTRSLDETSATGSRSFLERMKHTYEYKLKGFKGNIRGEHIQAPFTTLEEMLRTLPEPLGIDIELKYPMLWEAEDWKMDLYGVELNKFVDTTLQKVYTFGGGRNIIFTSFSPELCILLAHKQNQYPVLFLNESNLFPTGDVRASNLQEAVYFARRWNLPGVVMSSEPFIMSPKLMAYVKDAGLVCVSFGFLNNIAEKAKIQFDKLDAIITDDVNLIAHTQRSRSS